MSNAVQELVDTLAEFTRRHPRASEERIAALVVISYEIRRGRPAAPEPPKGWPLPEDPVEQMLRQLEKLAGVELQIAKKLLAHSTQK